MSSPQAHGRYYHIWPSHLDRSTPCENFRRNNTYNDRDGIIDLKYTTLVLKLHNNNNTNNTYMENTNNSG